MNRVCVCVCVRALGMCACVYVRESACVREVCVRAYVCACVRT